MTLTVAFVVSHPSKTAKPLYKDHTIEVKGVVTDLTNEKTWGGVDRVYIASASDLQRVGGVVERVTSTWNCSFDTPHADEMAQLHRSDTVILAGQIASYMNFRHCRVIKREPR